MPITQATRYVAVSSRLGEDVLVLREITATEELGRLFEFELEILSEDPGVAFKRMLGQNMTLRLELPTAKTRYFNAFYQTSRAEKDRYAAYRATLRPWLWFLTRTADCRSFQHKTAPDIIQLVFSDHGFSGYVDSSIQLFNRFCGVS